MPQIILIAVISDGCIIFCKCYPQWRIFPTNRNFKILLISIMYMLHGWVLIRDEISPENIKNYPRMLKQNVEDAQKLKIISAVCQLFDERTSSPMFMIYSLACFRYSVSPTEAGDGTQRFELAGYASLCRFYAYEGKVRPRVAHIMLLPQYRFVFFLFVTCVVIDSVQFKNVFSSLVVMLIKILYLRFQWSGKWS